jgi:hypothetical protein
MRLIFATTPRRPRCATDHHLRPRRAASKIVAHTPSMNSRIHLCVTRYPCDHRVDTASSNSSCSPFELVTFSVRNAVSFLSSSTMSASTMQCRRPDTRFTPQHRSACASHDFWFVQDWRSSGTNVRFSRQPVSPATHAHGGTPTSA